MIAIPAQEDDIFRPAIHYTAQNTWLNDPNGLVYHEGIYHLYYQNNPFGNVWGNMSWGHATSVDLISWDEQPVAILCDAEEDIYSGSIVVDQYNTSGLGNGLNAPLVAIYTSAYKDSSARRGTQAQSLAWSSDGGYTWTKYQGNPVLDRNSADFRDPKVFRYNGPPGSYWVMVAVEANEHRVVIYSSDNLRDWRYLSSFGPANATGGVWECPDLFPLPLDGDEERTKWILTVNLNPGGPNGGSGGQYFVGHFDGVAFTSETTVTAGSCQTAELDAYHWLDWGRDYYAAVSFNNAPDGRRLMVGWMNNWQYGAAIPTWPWRSSMSLVREMSLVTDQGQPRLSQRVADEYRTGHALSVNTWSDLAIDEGMRHLHTGAPVEIIEVTFIPESADEFGLIIRGNGTDGTSIGIRPSENRLIMDRTSSGNTEFHDAFASTDTAPLKPASDGSYTLTLFIDHCSVEVFAQNGQVTMTGLIFPGPDSTRVSLYAKGGTATAPCLKVTRPAGPAMRNAEPLVLSR
ncbi:glycoside hydrolase family 32 protein [Pseudarthrobacter sp. MM222]|uniref:glycoside hydrolase family 32 protein n=1 Tax=Pseudarthrobacter sp. MM222 TaxID=3018929 RepID=UPI00221E676A|nr:glycoside hydrolase family 32 protein [Pseudarthrobacter sp. MM222]CAI3792032.1 Levanase [Pseudarthrobacter sp. MM222]